MPKSPKYFTRGCTKSVLHQLTPGGEQLCLTQHVSLLPPDVSSGQIKKIQKWKLNLESMKNESA